MIFDAEAMVWCVNAFELPKEVFFSCSLIEDSGDDTLGLLDSTEVKRLLSNIEAEGKSSEELIRLALRQTVK